MAMERAALNTAKGRPVITADLPTPENVKSYITNCLKRYRQVHNLPADSVEVSDADCVPVARGSKATRDAYHLHSCGLSNPNCKKLEDYQTQIMLLEYQSKRRLMMARGEAEVAGTATKQPVTPPSLQDIKFRHYKLQDYQRQLMREGLHAKKEQPMANTADQGEPVAQSKLGPQDLLNEQAMENLSLEEYQKQLMFLRCGNHKYRLKFQPGVAECPRVPNTASGTAKPGALPAGVQQIWGGVPPIAPIPTGAPPAPARTSTDTSTMPADAKYLKDQAATHQRRSSIQDYEMQLMLLEQQNKKRLMMARNELDKVAADGDPKAQDNKPKMEMGSALGAQLRAQDKSDLSNPALRDYQMRLMLFEQQNKKRLILERMAQEKPSVSGPSHEQESEQIMEMGSALRAQNNGHDKSDLSGPSPAGTPLVVREDANGAQWIAFEYLKDGVKMEYTIRCDISTVKCDDLSPEFRTENCVYAQASVPIKEYKGSRLLYETECNNLGWALAELNPCLRNKRGLIGRAVDSYRSSIQMVVHPYCEDEEETAMWSTDEFDEWSNCGDDMETVEKDEV